MITSFTNALARYEAMSKRPRSARAWRAIASRLIHAAGYYSRSGDSEAAAKHLACAEQALARASSAPSQPAKPARSITS